MFSISQSQITEIGENRKATFEEKLWSWLEEDGAVWPSRKESDRKALYKRASELAAQHDAAVERYIAAIAHALDSAGDWRKFCETDELVTGTLYPEIDAPSFVKQMQQRAKAFLIEQELQQVTA